MYTKRKGDIEINITMKRCLKYPRKVMCGGSDLNLDIFVIIIINPILFADKIK